MVIGWTILFGIAKKSSLFQFLAMTNSRILSQYSNLRFFCPLFPFYFDSYQLKTPILSNFYWVRNITEIKDNLNCTAWGYLKSAKFDGSKKEKSVISGIISVLQLSGNAIPVVVESSSFFSLLDQFLVGFVRTWLKH